MTAETVIDIRGEPCGMPVLRVEKLLLGELRDRPFSVLGDHEQTMEQLQLLAARHGCSCTVAREGGGAWRARFRPAGAAG